VLEIQNLIRAYDGRVAVDNISFNVEKGEIVGFLGPNGAGKTTTMRVVTGSLMPTSGDVIVDGFNMRTHSREGRQRIGYLPEIVPLYTDMTIREYLKYVGRLHGLDRKRCRTRVDALVELCGLEEYIDTITGKLSKGFRQRVGLAQAIIHEPEVLILDEPTVGIDPIQLAQTRELIKRLGREHTVLLSTHVLPEVSAVCERVIIINRGKIVARDSIEKISETLKGGRRLQLTIQGPEKDVTSALSLLGSVREVIHEPPHHIVTHDSETNPQSEITKLVVENGWTLLAMQGTDMSLEDIFLDLTTEEEAGV
jgi:ABC-2 type transport system ATP-binding protein